ncbi:hypothetical protein ANCCAN_16714 [Ancylostoma caninum]|uniref:Uncharacterized protein n=1 Tax=Ancylostoma caninum TaxID=29170 RepID=A0A368FYY0_ANCCA|nr:hypothetical protein ANCCAN_16714 [Ancylostoma caninum]
MGNQYVKPPREGNSPYTRSGVPPPAILKKSGSDKPSHRLNDPMSLELHMADERVRAAGLSPAEREWRMKWIKVCPIGSLFFSYVAIYTIFPRTWHGNTRS